MAQLVKLQDYTSRYQIDLARYPTQFVRLKKSQWDRVKRQWEQGDEVENDWQHLEEEIEEKKSAFSFMKNLFKGRAKDDEVPQPEVEDIESVEVSNDWMDKEDEIPDEPTTLNFEANIVYAPQNLKELKRMFMNQFFHFQMKWASSTLREKSYVDPRFMRDTLLRTLLMRLPDNYLIFYYPIVKVKKAPVELDIIILTPTECYCIANLDFEDQAVYVGTGDRFWTKKVGTKDSKMLNPTINLNRSESILQQFFKEAGINMPTKKVILTRNGYFDYAGSVYNTEFIDKRNYQQWFNHLKRSSSPMKHMQIRAAQAILGHAQITSFNRDIWATDNEGIATREEEN